MAHTSAADAPETYFEHERPEVLALVPRDARRVLELGCASGRFAAGLKRRQKCHVTGIDVSPEVAEDAAARLDRLVVGDCEDLDLELLFQPDEFDCLVAADVLEHLRDPEHLLDRLQTFLAWNASIIVSIPNVRHAAVLQEAVQGYWTYQEQGILDRTHLRFFTRREIENLFGRLGFEVDELHAVVDPQRAEWERLGCSLAPKFGPMTVTGLDADEIREFFVVQWLLRLRSRRREDATRGDTPREQAGDHTPVVETVVWDMALFPRMTVTQSEVDVLSGQLAQEQKNTQLVKADLYLEKAERQQVDADRQQVRAELRLLEKGLHRNVEQLIELKRQHESLSEANQHLILEHEQLRQGYEAARRELDLALGSISWRAVRPLRLISRRIPGLSRLVRRCFALFRKARRAPGQLRRLSFSLTAMVAGDGAAAQDVSVIRPVFSLEPISSQRGPGRRQGTEKGRLLCVTHVLPYPTLAGNQYRIHRMLTWLSEQDWDIVVLVCPLPHESVTSLQIAETAAQYPKLIVCQRDGTLCHSLPDGGTMLDDLRGREPRAFAPLLGEVDDGSAIRRDVLNMTRTFCPDVLAEVLLHLESKYEPDVLLSEYVFMARPLPLIGSRSLKVIDTHDVFSSKQTKVTRYGVNDLVVPPELEAELLERGDLLIAIQPEEARDLRRLAPGRRVICVGVDFAVSEDLRRPSRPIVLFVASQNAINAKGLKDFLRFAWPLVLGAVPSAELHVVGAVAEGMDPLLPGVRLKGRVEDLADEYAKARVVINPAVAGTGLKIKTLEALCHLRPIVLWPSGVEGLSPEIYSLCHVAANWFDFARKVIDLVGADNGASTLMAKRPELAREFAPETVYGPLLEEFEASLRYDD